MHSEPVVESRAAGRARRRERGKRATEGPVFVDTSGRRSRVLRRIGLLVGVVCLAYAGVLGAAFMGWGTSLNPSSLLPFGNGQSGQGRPGDHRPGEVGERPADLSGGTPPTPPSGAASPSASASASASVPASVAGKPAGARALS